jgi:hypothetical protein
MPRPKGCKGHTDLEELFLRKCVPTPCKYPALGDCWIWTGAKMAPRFPGDPEQSQLNPKTWGTKYGHQWSCHHWNGSPLPIEPNMCVTHHCDTPLCVNPEHLKYDTWDTNFNEMYERNPTSLGRIVPTEEELTRMRALLAAQTSENAIAEQMGRSRRWVKRIRRDYNI